MPREYRSSREGADEEESKVDKRIYILGTGSIGKLVAHSLRGLPNPPPVTLLLHRGSLYMEWEAGPKQITLNTNGINVNHGELDAEMARPGWRSHNRQVTKEEFLAVPDPDDIPRHLRKAYGMDEESLRDEALTSPIRNLVISVKAPSTFSALNTIKHRLSSESCILFLQNGMGVKEEVTDRIFPDASTRPRYMQGIVSHGVHSNSPWKATLAGHGSIYISILPSHQQAVSHGEEATSSDRHAQAGYVLRTMLRSPILAAIPCSPESLLQKQLQKLAVNAVINPLTALLDARNGALLRNNHLERVIRLLLAEIGLVIRSLPEVKEMQMSQRPFLDKDLYARVVRVATSTANNISSMLADVRAGKRTEIDYINGYIVKRGEDMGIKCFMNYLVQQMIQGKRNVVLRERTDILPIISTGKGTGFLETNKGEESINSDAAESEEDSGISIRRDRI